MIKEAYCSFEISKLLKEKGFNEECFSYYHIYDREDFSTGEEYVSECNNNWEQVWDGYSFHNHNNQYRAARCTHQMAMAWLREKHIYLVFKPAYFSGEDCTYWSYEKWAGDNFEGEVLSFKSYEEAVEAALKYSLENLI